MTPTPDDVLIAHSLAEAYLYLTATPCSACGQGPLEGADAQRVNDADAEDHPAVLTAWRIKAACAACGDVATVVFQLPDASIEDTEVHGATVHINPTQEPSRILDVGQWIVLFRMNTEAASQEKDKTQVRRLGLAAAQCLEEALKFYDDPANDLPPSEAAFTVATRERLRRAPQQFSRRRLIELRAKLPRVSAVRSQANSTKHKRWWRG